MSFRIPPRGSYRVFYEATGDTLPAWFNILSAMSGARTENGLNVRLLLPHVVYLNQKQPLRKAEVAVRAFQIDRCRPESPPSAGEPRAESGPCPPGQRQERSAPPAIRPAASLCFPGAGAGSRCHGVVNSHPLRCRCDSRAFPSIRSSVPPCCRRLPVPARRFAAPDPSVPAPAGSASGLSCSRSSPYRQE